MRMTISSKNMELTPDLRILFEKKAEKLDRYLNPDTDVNVMFSQEGPRQSVEVTIPLEGAILRAEETGYDAYTSIDNVLQRIERQIHKHRTRLERRLKTDAFTYAEPLYFEGFSEIDEESEDNAPEIVRIKRFAVKPMDALEAVEQMEMLGHAFFVYLDADTEQVNVVYKRRDGNYGLIEAERA